MFPLPGPLRQHHSPSASSSSGVTLARTYRMVQPCSSTLGEAARLSSELLLESCRVCLVYNNIRVLKQGRVNSRR